MSSSALAGSVTRLAQLPTGLHEQPAWRYANASSPARNQTVGADKCFASWNDYISASGLERYGTDSLLSTSVLTTTWTEGPLAGFTTTTIRTYVNPNHQLFRSR